MTSALPMLRAIKDEDELGRLAAAGAAADECFQEILDVRFAGRFGVRIENIVTVTDDGGRRLNNTPREMADRSLTPHTRSRGDAGWW